MSKGKVIFKLDKVLKENNMAKYKLHTLTGINYDTIVRYCRGTVQRIPVEHLELFCDTLNCKISDIIEYVPEEQN